jgi:hypothetical protein
LQVASYAQAFVVGTYEDWRSGTEQMRYLHGEQTDCPVSYHNICFTRLRGDA